MYRYFYGAELTVYVYLLILLSMFSFVIGQSINKKLFYGTSLFSADACKAFLIFSLPFIAAISTATLMSTIAYHLAPWFALMIYFFAVSNRQRWSKFIVYYFSFFVSLLVLCQIVYGYTYPFRLTQTMYAQNKKLMTTNPSFKGLKVDNNAQLFFDQLYWYVTNVTKYKAGDPVMVFYNMPGIAYFLGGISPGSIYYRLGDNKENMLENCQGSNFNTTVGVQNGLIISTVGKELHPRVAGCLREAGIGFPEKYIRIAKIQCPYYGYVNMKSPELSIYAHQDMVRQNILNEIYERLIQQTEGK